MLRDPKLAQTFKYAGEMEFRRLVKEKLSTEVI